MIRYSGFTHYERDDSFQSEALGPAYFAIRERCDGEGSIPSERGACPSRAGLARNVGRSSCLESLSFDMWRLAHGLGFRSRRIQRAWRPILSRQMIRPRGVLMPLQLAEARSRGLSLHDHVIRKATGGSRAHVLLLSLGSRVSLLFWPRRKIDACEGLGCRIAGRELSPPP